jgi:pimeloyl-ACP methyl ester carboxylesterase
VGRAEDLFMPFATLNGIKLHYQLDGDAALPVLVLSNSLGTSLAMWDPQIPELSKHFRVLRYDTRGHGQSEVTPGPTPSPSSAATSSRCSTSSTSSKRTSAASPWAAAPSCGWR